MKINANDPRWTAYVLGELADEKDRAEVEAMLRESEDARALVEDIRGTAQLLAAELRAEPAAALSEAQRQRIETGVDHGWGWFVFRYRWAIATAAPAALAILIMFAIHPFANKEPTGPEKASSLPAIVAPAVQHQRAAISAGQAGNLQVPGQAAASVSSRSAEKFPAGQAALSAQPGKVNPEFPARAVGASNEVVTVTAGAEVVQTQSASISASLRGSTVTQLPMMSRNTLNFAYLAPGVPTATAAGKGGNPNAIIIDGAGAAGGGRGGMGAAGQLQKPVRLDSIQEDIPKSRFNTEAYDYIKDNDFQDVVQRPLSTFSIDVDTASYANMRRFVINGQVPPKDSVRIEELINYFSYDYLPPNDGKPFAARFEVTEAPWNPDHRLLRIGIKGRELGGSRPPCNLVFLLDVSGSMMDDNKLPLVKESMHLLLDQLTEGDRVAIVVYATQARVVLPSTPCDQKARIRTAIDSLQAGGTTNGAGGIQLAYDIAQQSFQRKGVNRVILATDGDFNVGITSRGDLTRLIEQERKSGIFLSALGFGMVNLKDSTLELLADKGDGNYAYIDTLNEARKVLAEELNGTLVPIAKDVKIQVEFNPAEVSAYRLIGYENRMLRKEDFNDDTKDAGEIGAGHALTVFYELVPAGQSIAAGKVDPLKYQRPAVTATPAARSGELLTLKIRHKEPDQQESALSEYVVRDTGRTFAAASPDFKFAAAVAAFGMWLRDSPYKGRANMEDIQQWAKQGQGSDPYGYRQEFQQLLRRAESLLRK